MSEIEKLMQNANIKKKKTHFQGFEDWFWEYPPFTAEKQLELIKWLAKNKNDFGLTFYDFEKEPQWESCCEFCWEEFNDTCKNIDFEQSLAGLINSLWQDLTEQEKEQIKEILK